MSSLSVPVLPRELEREIFELLVYGHPLESLSLMRVASRVHIWVEPLLYRTLIIGRAGSFTAHSVPCADGNQLNHILHSKSASFLASAVENLLVDFHYGVTEDSVRVLLGRCSGTRRLILLSSMGLKDSLKGMPHLSRLTCRDFSVLDRAPFPNGLGTITHLDLTYSASTKSAAAVGTVLRMPCLAYLALGRQFIQKLSDQETERLGEAIWPTGRLHALVEVQYAVAAFGPHLRAIEDNTARLACWTHFVAVRYVGRWAERWTMANLGRSRDIWAFVDERIRLRSAEPDEGPVLVLRDEHI